MKGKGAIVGHENMTDVNAMVQTLEESILID